MCQKSHRSRTLVLLALAGLLAIGASRWQSESVGQDKAPAAKAAPVKQAEQLSAAFRHASEVAMPSVVTVHSKTKARAAKVAKGNPHSKKGGDNPFKGTPFEEFFGGEGMPGAVPHARPQQGVGSGVIVDSSGIILTNNHVVADADEVVVELADGREFTATDVKTDPASDLAVVHIKGAGTLPAAALGDSDQMQIGDWVLAIGNPFELEQTVSAGIISGKGRELASTRGRMLQTDAAINPGNSGGPLINLEGEVIGINTAIATNNGAFQGVGFVIPSNLAKWVMGQLIKQGSVERAYLGILPSEVDRDIANVVHAKRGEGAIITEITADSPAAEAGLQTGDIITEVNGQKVHSPSELRELIERATVGSHQKLSILRDGKPLSIDVVPKAMPKDLFAQKGRPEVSGAKEEGPESYEDAGLGIEVSELSTQAAQALGLPKTDGVLITKVDPEGPAAEKGVTPGVVVLSVGEHLTKVKNIADFRSALKNESLEKGILLLVRSRTGNHFIVLKGSSDTKAETTE